MGILRTDRVAGLGGANAIKGSVFFDGASTLTVEDSDDFHYDTGDFTIEGWIFATGRDSQMMLLGQWDGAGSVAGSLAWAVQLTNNSNGFLRFLTSSTGTNVVLNQNATSGTVFDNKWHHFAVTRNGNDYKLFMDGVVVGSVTDSNAITNSPFPLTIGGSNKRYVSNADSSQTFTGFFSNIRIIKGEALYTAAFTPPTSELTVTSNTVFLGCQSSNILREETGKILSIDKSSANNSGPIPSRFTPNSPGGFSTTTDVGTQFGSTFDGVTTFDSQAYFVPPGGNTRERNRGRAIFAGGSRSPYKDIQVVDISSGGIAQDFGDTVSAAHVSGSASSSTRMLVTIGGSPSVVNTIEFITIADIASSTDFGDLTEPRRRTQSLSNSTRAVHVGGTSASPASLYRNEIDFNTIATAGNSTDFGDTLAAHVATGGSVASSTRGVYSVGYLSGSYVNNIEFITIATTGNGQDFGDLNAAKGYHFRGSICDSTRGLFAGGYNPAQNRIDFVTIASAGNATDFGDLFLARRSAAGTSNSTHSIFAGGYLPGVNNTIDRVVIQTTGNAADFGDLFFRTHENSGSSDSHGGLS